MPQSDQIAFEILDDDDGFEVSATWHGQCVGRLLCSRDGGQFILVDVHVEFRITIPWPLDRLLVWLGFPRRAICFRRRGIGGKLLSRFLAEARSRGGTDVIGFISDKDLHLSPFLPSWYERHGFTVRDGGYHPVLGKAAKTISLQIQGEDNAELPAAD